MRKKNNAQYNLGKGIIKIPWLCIPISKNVLIAFPILSLLVAKYLNIYVGLGISGFAFALVIQNLNLSFLTLRKNDRLINDYYSSIAFFTFTFMAIFLEIFFAFVTKLAILSGTEILTFKFFTPIIIGVHTFVLIYYLILKFIFENTFKKFENIYGYEVKVSLEQSANFLVVASYIFAIGGLFVNFLILLFGVMLYFLTY